MFGGARAHTMSSAAWALAGLIGGLTPRRSNISVRDGQRATEKLCVFFEAANSPWRQGIWMKCDRGIEINGETYPGVNLWSDTAPVPTVFTCRTGDGKLHLYNTWDDGNGLRSQSSSQTAGAIAATTSAAMPCLTNSCFAFSAANRSRACARTLVFDGCPGRARARRADKVVRPSQHLVAFLHLVRIEIHIAAHLLELGAHLRHAFFDF